MRYWTPENGLQHKRTVEMGNQIHDYRITSNNNRGQFRLLFSHKKGAIIPGMYSLQNDPQFRVGDHFGGSTGRRLFQILLTGSRALNILFYFPIKSKSNWTWAF